VPVFGLGGLLEPGRSGQSQQAAGGLCGGREGVQAEVLDGVPPRQSAVSPVEQASVLQEKQSAAFSPARVRETGLGHHRGGQQALLRDRRLRLGGACHLCADGLARSTAHDESE